MAVNIEYPFFLISNAALVQKEAKNNPGLRFELYLQKTYHKTASLLACGCRATAALVGHDAATCDRAFQYGKDIGMAFQVLYIECNSSRRVGWGEWDMMRWMGA
jgi:hypothetical protein